MRKTSSCAWITPVAGVLLALSGSPSLAQPGLTTFEATETICTVTPGKRWVTDDGATLHIRSQVHRNVVQSSEPRINGVNTAVISVNLNLTTQAGTANATFMLAPDSVNGTWQGTGVFQIKEGKAAGTAVGHGTGELEGQQIRLELREVAASANPPCTPAGPSGNVQTKINGFIFNPNGK
jgi:hypothetical protein